MATKTVQLVLVSTVKGQQVLTPVAVQIRNIGSAAQAAQPPIQTLQTRLNSFGIAVSKSLSNVRGTIVGLGTAMAVIGSFQIFKASFQEAIDFEKQMAAVNSILKSSEITIDDLRKQVIAMSGALGSSSEQAEGLYEALSAGIKPAQAIEFVSQAALLAKATLADLGDTTKLLATIMNAYGDRAGSVAHVTDILAAAIDEGIIKGNELGNAFESVINIAAVANLSFAEITSALATMTTVGISASEAGTALTRALTSYIDPSKEATEAVKEWNQAHKDAQIDLSATGLQARGLIGSLQDLVKATEGNIDKTRLFFGEQRALKGVLALTGDQMDEFVDRANRMNTAMGTAALMAERNQKSLDAQFKTAVNNVNKAVNELWQSLIDKLTPALVSFSEVLIAAVKGNFPDWVKTLAGAFVILAGAIALVKITQLSFQLGDLLLLIPKLSTTINGISFVAFTQGFTSIGAVISATVLNFGLFTTAALVAGSAIAGWKIGKIIGEIDSLSDILVVVIPPLGIFVKWLERLELISEKGKFTSLNTIVENFFIKGLEKMPQSLAATESAVQQLFLTLSGHGVVITQGNKSLQEWQLALLDAAKTLLKTRRDLENGTAANFQFTDSVEIMGEAVVEVDKRLQQLAESFRETIYPSETLASKISDLSKAGFTELEIMKGLSGEIVEVAKKEEELNGVLNRQIAIRLERAKAIEENIKWLRMEIPAAKELFDVSKFGEVEEFLPFGKTSLADQQKEFENFVDAIDRMREDWAERAASTEERITEVNKQQLAIRLSLYANFFGTLSRNIGGFAGKIADALAAGFAAASDIAKQMETHTKGVFGNTLTMANVVAASIGAIFTQLSQHMEGASQKIVSAIGAIATGFAMGGWLGAAIAGVGVLVNIFTSLEKSIRKATNAARAFGFEITEALAKELLEFAKQQKVSLETAVLANLDKVLAETKITAENLNWVIYAFDRAFATFAAGSDLALKAINDLNDVFPQMLDAGTDSFGRLNKQMLDFIARLQAAGIEVKALTEYMKSQFASAGQSLENLITAFADGLEKRLEGIDLENLTKFDNLKLNEIKAEFDDFFTLLFAQINRMQEQGFSLVEIFEVLGPSIEKLREAAIDLGLKGTPAFAALNQLFRVMRSESAQTLGDINNLLVTFHNAGILTQKTFSSLEDIFSKVYKEFNKDGKISRAEMAAMLPTLAQLRYMSERYGFTLDKTTQKLIEQAIQQGHLSEEVPIDPMDRLATIVDERLVPALDKLNATLLQTMGIVNQLDGSSIDITTNYSTTGIPPETPDDVFLIANRVPSFQGISKPVSFKVAKQEQPLLVHKGEEVTITPANSSTPDNSKYEREIIRDRYLNLTLTLPDGKVLTNLVVDTLENGADFNLSKVRRSLNGQ